MISEYIHNSIRDILSKRVDKISIHLFEELLEMRDKMVRFNEYVPSHYESITSQLLEEILQTFLEELLPKVNIAKT